MAFVREAATSQKVMVDRFWALVFDAKGGVDGLDAMEEGVETDVARAKLHDKAGMAAREVEKNR